MGGMAANKRRSRPSRRRGGNVTGSRPYHDRRPGLVFATMPLADQMAITLHHYMTRGEWDGRSVAGARQALAMAHYPWSAEIRQAVSKVIGGIRHEPYGPYDVATAKDPSSRTGVWKAWAFKPPTERRPGYAANVQLVWADSGRTRKEAADRLRRKLEPAVMR
jgi:hypothetical protein